MLIATDGLCKGNTGGSPGSWAFAVFDPKSGKYIGHKKAYKAATTNNEMELTAILEALKWADKYKIKVHILSDSSYSIKCLTEWYTGWMTRGWKTSKNEPIKNLDIIREAKRLLDKTNSTIEWVKGHSGNKYNEMADTLCNEEYFKHTP
jgi:ribonuclease HI